MAKWIIFHLLWHECSLIAIIPLKTLTICNFSLLSQVVLIATAIFGVQFFFLLFFIYSLLCSCTQIVVWRFLQRSKGSDVLATKQALLFIILLQYIPRFLRMVPLTSELKRTAGVFAETAWAGAAYYLLLFMLASHVSCVYCLIWVIMHAH